MGSVDAREPARGLCPQRNDALTVAPERDVCPRDVQSVTLALVSSVAAVPGPVKSTVGRYRRAAEDVFVKRMGQNFNMYHALLRKGGVWRLAELRLGKNRRLTKDAARMLGGAERPPVDGYEELWVSAVGAVLPRSVRVGDATFAVTTSAKSACQSHYDKSLAPRTMQRLLDLVSRPFWIGAPRFSKGEPMTSPSLLSSRLATAFPSSSVGHWALQHHEGSQAQLLVDVGATEGDEVLALRVDHHEGGLLVVGPRRHLSVTTGGEQADRLFAKASVGKSARYVGAMERAACDMHGGPPGCAGRTGASAQELFFRSADPLVLPFVGLRTAGRGLGSLEATGPTGSAQPLCHIALRIVPTERVHAWLDRLGVPGTAAVSVFRRAPLAASRAVADTDNEAGRLAALILEHNQFTPQPLLAGPYEDWRLLRRRASERYHNDAVGCNMQMCLLCMQAAATDDVMFPHDTATFPYSRDHGFAAYPHMEDLPGNSALLVCLAGVAMCGRSQLRERISVRAKAGRLDGAQSRWCREVLRLYDGLMDRGPTQLEELRAFVGAAPRAARGATSAEGRVFYYPPPGGHCLVALPSLESFADATVRDVLGVKNGVARLRADNTAVLLVQARHPQRRVCRTCAMNEFVLPSNGLVRIRDVDRPFWGGGFRTDDQQGWNADVRRFLESCCGITAKTFPLGNMSADAPATTALVTDASLSTFGKREWLSPEEIAVLPEVGAMFALPALRTLREQWPPPLLPDDTLANPKSVQYHKPHAAFCPANVPRTVWKAAREHVLKSVHKVPESNQVGYVDALAAHLGGQRPTKRMEGSTMTLVAQGNDGLVVRFEQSPVARHPALTVAKFYYAYVRYDDALHARLAEADPTGRYFATYLKTNVCNLQLSAEEQTKVQETAGQEIKPFATLSPQYTPIPDPRRLSKAHYRHLRAAVELLTSLGISHNDLPDNVMINPRTNLPVIVDFVQATDDGPAHAQQMVSQRNTFLRYFAKGA